MIIFGSTFDEKLEGVMRVSIVATGIEAGVQRRETPTFVQAPITRRSTIISAPATAGAAAAMPAATAGTAADDTPAPVTAEDGTAEDMKGESKVELTAPEDISETTSETASQATSEATLETADTETVDTETTAAGDTDEDLPYVPAFVPTKASRLAFLATGKPAPRDLALTGSLDEQLADADDGADQMSIDEAIAAEQARVTADMAVEPAATAGHLARRAASNRRGGRDGCRAVGAAASVRPRRPGRDAGGDRYRRQRGRRQDKLINKISGLWTAKPQDEAAARREPEVEAAPAETAGPAILDLPRADAMSRMPETPAAATLDSQSDDLEIPAFLRRQAN